MNQGISAAAGGETPIAKDYKSTVQCETSIVKDEMPNTDGSVPPIAVRETPSNSSKTPDLKAPDVVSCRAAPEDPAPESPAAADGEASDGSDRTDSSETTGESDETAGGRRTPRKRWGKGNLALWCEPNVQLFVPADVVRGFSPRFATLVWGALEVQRARGAAAYPLIPLDESADVVGRFFDLAIDGVLSPYKLSRARVRRYGRPEPTYIEYVEEIAALAGFLSRYGCAHFLPRLHWCVQQHLDGGLIEPMVVFAVGSMGGAPWLCTDAVRRACARGRLEECDPGGLNFTKFEKVQVAHAWALSRAWAASQDVVQADGGRALGRQLPVFLEKFEEAMSLDRPAPAQFGSGPESNAESPPQKPSSATGDGPAVHAAVENNSMSKVTGFEVPKSAANGAVATGGIAGDDDKATDGQGLNSTGGKALPATDTNDTARGANKVSTAATFTGDGKNTARGATLKRIPRKAPPPLDGITDDGGKIGATSGPGPATEASSTVAVLNATLPAESPVVSAPNPAERHGYFYDGEWKTGDLTLKSADRVCFRVPAERLLAFDTKGRLAGAMRPEGGGRALVFGDGECESANVLERLLDLAVNRRLAPNLGLWYDDVDGRGRLTDPPAGEDVCRSIARLVAFLDAWELRELKDWLLKCLLDHLARGTLPTMYVVALGSAAGSTQLCAVALAKAAAGEGFIPVDLAPGHPNGFSHGERGGTLRHCYTADPGAMSLPMWRVMRREHLWALCQAWAETEHLRAAAQAEGPGPGKDDEPGIRGHRAAPGLSAAFQNALRYINSPW